MMVFVNDSNTMCCKCNQQTHLKVIMTLDKIFLVWVAMWYIHAFRLKFDDMFSIVSLSVAIVSFIASEGISHVLAIKKSQYILLPFMIYKCVFVGLSIASGMLFYLAIGQVSCRTWFSN